MNTFITPEWITKEGLYSLQQMPWNQAPIGETIQVRLPKRFETKSPEQSVNGKVLLALGAAAVIANPEPISRRSLFGLNWFKKGQK